MNELLIRIIHEQTKLRTRDRKVITRVTARSSYSGRDRFDGGLASSIMNGYHWSRAGLERRSQSLETRYKRIESGRYPSEYPRI